MKTGLTADRTKLDLPIQFGSHVADAVLDHALASTAAALTWVEAIPVNEAEPATDLIQQALAVLVDLKGAGA